MADKTTTLKTKTNDNVYPNVIGDNMDNAIVDSAHINHTLTKDHKINFRLDDNVSHLIFNSLQKPAGLTKTELVGVGTNGQENIEIGDNLTLANGKLSATGGGGEEFNELIVNNYLSEADIIEIAGFLTNSSDFVGIHTITKKFTGTVSFSNDKPIKVIINLDGDNIVFYAYKAITGYGFYYLMTTAWAGNIKTLILGYLVGSFVFSTYIDSIKFYVIGDTQKPTYYHFITLTSSTYTFYLTYQNTSNEQLNTLDSLKTALAGKYLLCTGHTDSEIAEYISGEGGNIVVGVVDISDNSTSGITIDSSFTITDDVSPVE